MTFCLPTKMSVQMILFDAVLQAKCVMFNMAGGEANYISERHFATSGTPLSWCFLSPMSLLLNISPYIKYAAFIANHENNYVSLAASGASNLEVSCSIISDPVVHSPNFALNEQYSNTASKSTKVRFAYALTHNCGGP